jgi:hypothetical protein
MTESSGKYCGGRIKLGLSFPERVLDQVESRAKFGGLGGCRALVMELLGPIRMAAWCCLPHFHISSSFSGASVNDTHRLCKITKCGSERKSMV